MTIRRFLAVAIAPFLLLAAPAWAQKQAEAAPSPSPEAALAAVARHLSDAYALYLYESLTAQVLFNEGLLERPNSPLATKAKDSLWALEIISNSILAEGEDGIPERQGGAGVFRRHRPPVYERIALLAGSGDHEGDAP